MILLVFEGQKRELKLFDMIKDLGMFRENHIVCSFCSDIQSLYKRVKMIEDGIAGTADVVQLLLDMNRADTSELVKHNIRSSYDVEDVYLFFDCDLHNTRFSLRAQLLRIRELLTMFNNATGNGKLYISYPMIEAIRYTETLPDRHFCCYTFPISRGKKFKHESAKFSKYPSFEFQVAQDSNKVNTLSLGWSYLIRQHRSKAQRLCRVSAREPLSQSELFRIQCKKFIIPRREVAILASIPLFLYDYFKEEKRKELGFSLEE